MSMASVTAGGRWNVAFSDQIKEPVGAPFPKILKPGEMGMWRIPFDWMKEAVENERLPWYVKWSLHLTVELGDRRLDYPFPSDNFIEEFSRGNNSL